MKATLKSMIHHATTRDGKDADCCGCWHLVMDDEAEWPLQVVCNECSEVRDIGRADLDA